MDKIVLESRYKTVQRKNGYGVSLFLRQRKKGTIRSVPLLQKVRLLFCLVGGGFLVFTNHAAGKDISPDQTKIVQSTAYYHDGVLPYPDIWGIELPLPENESMKAYPSALYEDEKGDVVVRYPVFFQDKHLVRYVSFFSGELQHEYFFTTEKDMQPASINYKKTLKKIKEYTTSSSPYIFDDGGRLEGNYIFSNNMFPIDGWFEKYDRNGNKVFSRILLYKSATPKKIFVPMEDDMSDGSRSSDVWAHTFSFGCSSIWKLRDGTYLVGNSKESILLRFRQDFSSPYIDRSDKFLMVDAKPFIEKYMEIYLATLTEKPIERRKPPSSGNFIGWIWAGGCMVRAECLDRKMTAYFDEEMEMKRGKK